MVVMMMMMMVMMMMMRLMRFASFVSMTMFFVRLDFILFTFMMFRCAGSKQGVT
jgi:hypothetical protein